MKKLLLFLTAISLNVFSQTNPITLYTSESYNVNTGDSTWVAVGKFVQNPMTDSVYLFIVPYGSSVNTVLYGGTYNDIYNMESYVVNSTVYKKIKIKIPINNTLGINWYRLGYDHQYFNAACGGLTVNVSNTTGIETIHSKEDLMSTEYFNLLGQPISKPDGVMVEIKTYRDGTKNIRKTIQ